VTVRLQHPPILSHRRLNLTPSAGSTIVPFNIIVAAPVTSSSGRHRITSIP